MAMLPLCNDNKGRSIDLNLRLKQARIATKAISKAAFVVCLSMFLPSVIHAALAIQTETLAHGKANDIMLLLDNSGSMRANDPQRLLPDIVTEFIQQQGSASRIGIVIFDSNARLALPLTELGVNRTNNIHRATLAQVNYRGALTNTPAAVERALYELRVNGKAAASKSIVLISDGIVDVGDRQRSLQADQWLKEQLVALAAQQKIKIFAIGITEKSDYRLLQTMAQATNGAYYRVLSIEDVPLVLKQINQHLNLAEVISTTILLAPPEASIEDEASTVAPRPAPSAPSQAATSTKWPQQTSTVASVNSNRIEDKTLATTTLGDITVLNVQGLLGLLLLSAIALVVALLMKLKSPTQQHKPINIPSNQEYFPKAYLIDLHGMTDKAEHALDHKYNLISRVDPDAQSNIHYITIKKSAVSRRHALIKYYDMSFWLIDQRSVNGTFINGERIYDEIRLKHGDRVKFHSYEFEFSMAELIFSNETSALPVQQ